MILAMETQITAQPVPIEPGPCQQCGGPIPRRAMPNGVPESVTGWRKRKYCCTACWGAYVTLHPEARRGGRPKRGQIAPRLKLGRPRLTERVERLERVVVGLMSEREKAPSHAVADGS